MSMTTRQRPGRGLARIDDTAVSPLQIGLAVAALAGVLGAGGAIYFDRGGTPLDANLCPTGGAGRHLLVLVDQSDVATPDQRRTIETTLRQAVSRLAAGDRFTLYKLSPTGERFVDSLIDLCRPKSGAEADAKQENPRHVDRTFRERYAQPLERAIVALSQPAGPEPSSPLVEALHAIAHGPAMQARARERQFIIYSDLMQLSSTGDAYKTRLSVDALRDSVYADAPLEQVAVTIYQLRSAKLAQRQADAAQFFRTLIERQTGVPPVLRAV